MQAARYHAHCVYRDDRHVLSHANMVPLDILLAATIGIGMASGAAAAFNCLVEQTIDAKMARTRGRPLPTGQVTSKQTFIFATIMASIGLAILYFLLIRSPCGSRLPLLWVMQ